MDKIEERLNRLEKKQDGFFYRKSISLGWLTWIFIIYSSWTFVLTFDINETISKFVNNFFFTTLIRDFFTVSFQKRYFIKE